MHSLHSLLWVSSIPRVQKWNCNPKQNKTNQYQKHEKHCLPRCASFWLAMHNPCFLFVESYDWPVRPVLNASVWCDWPLHSAPLLWDIQVWCDSTSSETTNSSSQFFPRSWWRRNFLSRWTKRKVKRKERRGDKRAYGLAALYSPVQHQHRRSQSSGGFGTYTGNSISCCYKTWGPPSVNAGSWVHGPPFGVLNSVLRLTTTKAWPMFGQLNKNIATQWSIICYKYPAHNS